MKKCPELDDVYSYYIAIRSQLVHLDSYGTLSRDCTHIGANVQNSVYFGIANRRAVLTADV